MKQINVIKERELYNKYGRIIEELFRRIRNESGDGMLADEGTYCSRGTYVNGNAILLACEDAKRQLFERSSVRLGVPAERLATENCKVYDKENPDKYLYFHDLYIFMFEGRCISLVLIFVTQM